MQKIFRYCRETEFYPQNRIISILWTPSMLHFFKGKVLTSLGGNCTLRLQCIY